MVRELLHKLPHRGPVAAPPKLADEALLLWPFPQSPPNALLGACGWGTGNLDDLCRSQSLSHAETASTRPQTTAEFELAVEEMVPGYGSSDHDPTSFSLYAMVHEFMENDGFERHERDAAEVFERNSSKDGREEMTRMLQRLAVCTDSFEATLLSSTQKILDSFATDGSHCDSGKVSTLAHSCLKRLVVCNLRTIGYCASICRTKWDHTFGMPAGDYEYIDVQFSSDGLLSGRPERVIVDIDFHLQFKIARPTDEFQRLWKILPPTFVGRPDRLKRIVNIMSDATKQSLKVNGLHLPPWRKPAYMRAKWFSSYRRSSSTSSVRHCNVDVNALGSTVRGGAVDGMHASARKTLHYDVNSNAWLGRAISKEKTIGPERVGNGKAATASDWQPPAVDPQRFLQRKGRTSTGLSSLLLQRATGMCNHPGNHPVVQVV